MLDTGAVKVRVAFHIANTDEGVSATLDAGGVCQIEETMSAVAQEKISTWILKGVA
jgi:hypothetical protein